MRRTPFAFVAMLVAVWTAVVTRRRFAVEAIATMPACVAYALGKPLAVGKVFLIVAGDDAVEPLPDRHAGSLRRALSIVLARTKASQFPRTARFHYLRPDHVEGAGCALSRAGAR
jgi:hypothetical protein